MAVCHMYMCLSDTKGSVKTVRMWKMNTLDDLTYQEQKKVAKINHLVQKD